MKLVIDRKVWMRGVRGESRLLTSRDDGRKQCCVGIYLSACGVPDEQLSGAFYATAQKVTLPSASKWLVETIGENWRGEPIKGHTKLAGELYSANDESGRSQQDRESRIAELFAKQGIEVEFTGNE